MVMLRTSRFSWALLIAPAICISADNAETLPERSQAAARAVLDRAIEVNGGAEALRAIKTVRLRLEGQTWPRLQMTTPAPPFEPGSLGETLLVDLENNRMLLEQRVSGAGFEGHNTISIKSGQGTNFDHRARTATPIPAAQSSQQQFTQYYRRLPNLLLQQALNGANTLRHLGQEDFDGRRHEVITFVMPDAQQVGLYIDARTGLVSKYELIFVDSLAGEEASEIIFSDYVRVGQYQLPRRWTQRLAGELASRYDLKAEINPPAPEQAFDVAANGYASAQALPLNLEENVDKLADGVFVIQNVAGQNQNTLAVEFADHVLAVEAPGTSDGANEVITRIKELIPGKPIRYVAMTHHHGDHIGGLRSFIAEGAAVVTTPGNRAVVETMAGAKQNDRLARQPRPVRVELIQGGRRAFTDGSRTVELIDIGPNPHAREMVIAWLPKERVVFQGDLFFVPNNDAPPGPPQPSTASFAQKLKELRLPVERVASVHGRTAAIDYFRKATE
jgi:glyoxylase-like metal-dependent hydrolase (beta-lactamase superfamily II)